MPSSYCADLVSPMNQLLKHALQDRSESSGNDADKFVFVSDSTLPAKPFWTVYHTLTTRSGSDFCIFPSRDWADVHEGPAKHGVAIKAHQWMVLSRPHAERSVRLWDNGTMQDMMIKFHLNQDNSWQHPGNRTLGDHRNYGCLDEYWHIYVLFGSWALKKKQDEELHDSSLTNSPLRISPDAGWQGTCDTFALWPDFMHDPVEGELDGKKQSTPWLQLFNALDLESRPHLEENRPAWWDKISLHGIGVIRDSDFLFVRKFSDNPHLVDEGNFIEEYSRIVLSSVTTHISPIRGISSRST